MEFAAAPYCAVTGIAVVQGGLPETLICWAGIVGVNMAQALGARRRR